MKRKQIMRTSSAMIIMDCSPSKVATSPKKKKARTTKSMIEIEKPKSLAEEKAEEIQSSLDPKFPSQVSGGFWLGLPSKFCSSSLPKSDTNFTLVDEDEEEYTANYLPRKLGLSGGWRGFSIAHKLVEGDALVFHLVDVSIFKVYMVRSHTSADVDTSPDLLKLECNTEGTDTGTMDKKKSKKGAQKRVKFHPTIVLDEDEKLDVPSEGSHQPEDRSSEEVIDSDVPEGIKLLGYMDEFQEMKNLESFTVEVNDLAIDFEIPKHIQSKYYELCRSQNSSLHKDLVMGSNSKLVVGIIFEVVNLAEGIRACKLSTPREELEAWENSLKAFKQLGMNTGFLLSGLANFWNYLPSRNKHLI
ncbi:hypothetical protein MKX03_020491 [Papaver bracteatum]|nr:hypothetical protein MKX03_020491 [Papaver bracteatum]